jgi:hypothetical protein
MRAASHLAWNWRASASIAGSGLCAPLAGLIKASSNSAAFNASDWDRCPGQIFLDIFRTPATRSQFGGSETLNAVRMTQFSLFTRRLRVAPVAIVSILRTDRRTAARRTAMQATTRLALGWSAPTLLASTRFRSAECLHGVVQPFFLRFARVRTCFGHRLRGRRLGFSDPPAPPSQARPLPGRPFGCCSGRTSVAN